MSEEKYAIEQILDAITQADEEIVESIRYKDGDMLEDLLRDYLHWENEMNGDLISRGALSKKICNKECDVPKFETEVELNAFLLGLNAKQIAVMECLSDIPTAYDVNKVVEQLKSDEKELQAIIESGARDIYKNTNYGYFTAMNRAIDIVKSGGIE